MKAQARPPAAPNLEADLRVAAEALISVLQRIEPECWMYIPDSSVWSVGKDAAHVAEAAVYHQWIVRRTVGERVSSKRPGIERRELTTTMTAQEAVDLIRRRTEEGAALIGGLSDDQLALPTRPPRTGAPTLADLIAHVLVRHYDGHRRDIERKLDPVASGGRTLEPVTEEDPDAQRDLFDGHVT
jgi:uncharacterized damage-inducible protein DinB